MLNKVPYFYTVQAYLDLKQSKTTMSENQNTEWKQSWRDEYLKWICGFANAEGGTLEIGKDDKGNIVGLSNARKLMEDLPNKIRDVLGILVDVNLNSQSGIEWIAIEVDSYHFPVNYKGQFHYRSGSTKQELKGAALNKFLLQKQGKNWDSVPVPHVIIKDLSAAAFAYFKKQATQTKRLDKSILKKNRKTLIEKLRLNEKEYLKRAAVLLFHSDPEEFFTGAYIKIGYFRTETDLRFQDEVHGYLFEQVEKTMDLLLSKYLEAQIRYQGISRIEEYAYPEEALREAVLNAVAHKDYSSGNPIQIKVYDDHLSIWNAGELQEPLTVKKLLVTHPSMPYNPDIATTFFRAGLIEAWGRGTIKIIQDCKTFGLPTPTFSTEFSGLMVIFYSSTAKTSVKTSEKTSEKTSVKTSEKILVLMKENKNITIAELAKKIGVAKRSIERNLQKLKEEKQIERIGSARGGYWKVSD